MEVSALVRSRERRATILKVIAASCTWSEYTVAAVPVDLVFAHVLEILYDLCLLFLALSTQIIPRVLQGHADVLLLKSVLSCAARLLGILAIAVVLFMARAVARNDLDFDLIGLWKAKSFRKEAAALLLAVLAPLQRFVVLAVWRTLLCIFAKRKVSICTIRWKDHELLTAGLLPAHQGMLDRAGARVLAHRLVAWSFSVDRRRVMLTSCERRGRALVTLLLLVLC